jgi:O-antigen ligase
MILLTKKRDDIHENLFLIFAIAIVVSFPFSIKLNGMAMILLSLNWIMEGEWSSKFEMLKQKKIALLFLALYGLHIIGLIHTENILQGFSELEKKVAFVIFPVVFSTSRYVYQAKVLKILNYFVATCFVAAVICVINGMYYYLLGDPSYLFYHKLGSIIGFDHAVYFSFYVCVSMFYLLILLESRWRDLRNLKRCLYVLIIAFFFIFLLLLSSKTLIVTFFLLLLFFIGRKVFQKKGVVIGILSVLLSLSLSMVILFAVPNVKQRFQEVLIDEYDQINPLFLDDYAYYHFTGGAIRLAIWKMTVQVVNREAAWLWGVGTGDSQDNLTAIYIEKHVYGGEAALGIKGFLHYNTHNQFLQFFLMFGVLGLALFIYILICLVKYSLIHSKFLFYVSMLFLAFSITESTLHVQKGIVPFLFLTTLITSKATRMQAERYLTKI